MEETSIDFIVSIAALAGIFGIIYLFIMTRHKERMLMMQKGVNAEMFESKNNFGSITLKLGMLFIGVALGIFIGNLLYNFFGIEESVTYLTMIFFFGGVSLIINFLISQKIKN